MLKDDFIIVVLTALIVMARNAKTSVSIFNNFKLHDQRDTLGVLRELQLLVTHSSPVVNDRIRTFSLHSN